MNVKKQIFAFCNEKVIEIIYMFGEYLNQNPKDLSLLYEYLYKLYGNTIVFSKRSLVFAEMFYKKYHDIFILIPKSITWNQIVKILRKNNFLQEDIYIFEVIDLFSLNEKEIDYFLDTGNIKFMNDTFDVNNIVLEFMNL